MDNQSRVSNWVSSQSSHSYQYSNPFVPPTYEAALARDTQRSSAKESSRSRSRSSTVTSTATPTRHSSSHAPHSFLRRFDTEHHSTSDRPRTMPSNHIIAPQPRYPIIPTSNAIVVPNVSHDRHHQSTHQSSTRSPPSRSHHHHRKPSSSRSYSVPISSDRDSSGRTFIQIGRDAGNKVVHIPPPRHGEQYVIIPPPGGKVEVVHPQSYHQLDYKEHDREREMGGQQETTFLKRFFRGLAGGSGESRTSSSRSRTGFGLDRRRRSH